MSNRYQELLSLKKDLQEFIVEGLENLPNKRCIIVANHCDFNDVFYISMAMPRKSVAMMSSRTFFEKNEFIEKYLYCFPIEIRYKNYTKLCIEYMKKLLQDLADGILTVFPEGVYDNDEAIYKGRTGAIQLLFAIKELGLDISLVPVSINATRSPKITDNKVTVKILPSLDYRIEYEKYISAKDLSVKNEQLHLVMDKAMQEIAVSLKREYKDTYLELFKRDYIPLPTQELFQTENKADETCLPMYEEYLARLEKQIVEELSS